MALPIVTMECRAVEDASLRFSPGGVAVGKVRVVASSRKQNDSGEWVDDKTCWLNVTAFKRQAENLAESVTKGVLITVTGRLQTEDWEDREGNKRTSLNVLADSIGLSTSITPARPIGESRSSGGSSSGGRAERRQSRDENDPWATGPSSQDEEPPF